MIQIKLFNYEIELFIKFLFDLKLVDQKSRMRTRFIRLLSEKLQLFEEERLQLLKEHSYLDEQGNIRVIEKDGDTLYDVKDLNKFNIAVNQLLYEEVVIEQNIEREVMLLTVKDIVLNCGLEFVGKEAVNYDRFCEIVEQINYESNE